MTAVIDANFSRQCSFLNQIENHHQNRLQTCMPQKKLRNSTEFQRQNYVSIVIKQFYCPYDLLLTLTSTPFITLLKIHLMKENGILLKIAQQQAKTQLIRKFIHSDNLYTPRIDPATGTVYFRIEYFNIKPIGQILSEKSLRSLYKNLNSEKLFQSIQKFISVYQNQKYNNWIGGDFEMKKKYQQLSKTICSLNDSQLMKVFSQNNTTENQVKTQNPEDPSQKKLISEMDHFALSSEKNAFYQVSQRMITKEIKQIEILAESLATMTKRKQGKSNYEHLHINIATQKKLKEKLNEMVATKARRATMKVTDSEMDKITLNIHRQEDITYRLKIQFLSLLPRNTEYHFLDKYFKSTEVLPVLMTLSLKEEPLQKFLQTNSMCISMQTKMRILLQICSAVHTLWQQKNVILDVSNFSKIHITKNLTIKLRDISNYFKPDTHQLLEGKAELNMKLLDNWLNMSQIYFKLFFNHDLYFSRPSLRFKAGVRSTSQAKRVIMSQGTVGVKLLPQGFNHPAKQMLVGLNYIFLSYIDKASKMVQGQEANKNANLQVYEPNNKGNLDEQSAQDSAAGPLLNFKLTCCWLFKNFEMISTESL